MYRKIQYTRAAVKYHSATSRNIIECDEALTLSERYYQTLAKSQQTNFKKANFFYQTQLQGMKTILAAWKQVSPETIKHCYNHTGLFSSTPSVEEDAITNSSTTAIENYDLDLSIRESLTSLEVESSIDSEDVHENSRIRQIYIPEEDWIDAIEDEEDEDEEDRMTEADRVNLQLEACNTLLQLCKLDDEDSISMVFQLSKYARKIKEEEIRSRTKQSLITDIFTPV